MWKHGGQYFLFYSGGPWDSPYYAVGYATCKTALGPCTDYAKNPILKEQRGCKAEGPGGETIVADAGGQTWMAYHAWVSSATDYGTGGMRALWIDRLNWVNGKPSINGPDCKKEPAPAT
jgi:beta-xylosidase